MARSVRSGTLRSHWAQLSDCSSTLRLLCAPGDTILILEPFHELYPQQAHLFHVQTRYSALKLEDGENGDKVNGTWTVDWADFKEK